MDEVEVEVVCAEGFQGLIEAFGDAVVVGVPTIVQGGISHEEENRKETGLRTVYW